MYNVLICDDDVAAIDLLVKNVHWADFRMQVAETAVNGKLGLEVLQKHKIDVVILDIMMPMMNGMTLAREIRKKDNRTKIIFITSSDSLNDAIRAINMKADGYILKPFSVSEIEGILQNVKKALDAERMEGSPEADPVEEDSESKNLVQQVDQYIKDHLGEKILLADIAKYFGYASNYLGQLYKTHTGIYLSDQILKIKMEYAAELLRGPFNQVGEVAKKLGYSDYTYFIRQFKDYYGVTPNAYKKGNI